MTLVMTLVAHGDPEVVDAHIAFHLNAGVDFVLVAHDASSDGTTELLESYVRDGAIRRLPEQGNVHEGESRTRMARLAAAEHGADWLISSGVDEFWWPRAESLAEVLRPIPPRYSAVQGLVRTFVRAPGDAGFFADRMTVRRARPSRMNGGQPSEGVLRPIVRAHPEITFASDGPVVPRYVPLRAWYPIEVFRLPLASTSSDLKDESALAQGLSDGSLVEDPRLRDALRALRVGAAENGSPRRYEIPGSGGSRLALQAPDVVDDAAYSVECAEVGEVDLTEMERHVDDLERRIAWLEQRFWPRVLRRLTRLARRSAT
jgi:Glycosyl transferase family 2